jgi:D-alanyl-D-alanine carboxypeptidase
MNKEAKSLNLIETRFGNPHGLPHKYARSTAFDIAKLCIYCMKD